MKFRLKTSVELSKEFEIEAESLKDATKMVDDPTIREYTGKLCKEKLAKRCATQRL